MTFFLVNFYLNSNKINNTTKKTTPIPDKDKNQESFQSLGEYGIIDVYNVTIDRIIAEIGENITVSTVYSCLLNEGYFLSYGRIGIYKATWYQYLNRISEGFLVHNVTEIISIDPNYFDSSDICTGNVQIRIFNLTDPFKRIDFINNSKESLELRRAGLHYKIINQNPLTIFMGDKINLSILVHNEHTEKYVFSNENININISSSENSQIFSKNTNISGIFNLTIDSSILGIGNYTIRLNSTQTLDYEPSDYTFHLTVLNETTSINCTILNPEVIFVGVDSDSSPFSNIFIRVKSQFDAQIAWFSTFGSGIFSKTPDYFEAIITSPNQTGLYTINFIVTPQEEGKIIEFTKEVYVKKRPIEVFPTFLRGINQSNIWIILNVKDQLNNQSIESGSKINMYIQYNDSNHNLGNFIVDSNGSINVKWEIPPKIIDDFLTFGFQLNQSPVYEDFLISQNLIITKIEYFGPLNVYISNNITIAAKLLTLNGSVLSNHIVFLRINDENYSLKTNSEGDIKYSIIAPSYSSKLKIEIYFPSHENMISSFLSLEIEVKLNLIHQFWNSLGYILIGVSVGAISVLYLKRLLTKRNLANLNVD